MNNNMFTSKALIIKLFLKSLVSEENRLKDKKRIDYLKVFGSVEGDEGDFFLYLDNRFVFVWMRPF